MVRACVRETEAPPPPPCPHVGADNVAGVCTRCAVFEGTDACFAPVLSMEEATKHPHNVARKSFLPRAGTGRGHNVDQLPDKGVTLLTPCTFLNTDEPETVQAAPAPVLSRTPGLANGVAPAGPEPGQHTHEVMPACTTLCRQLIAPLCDPCCCCGACWQVLAEFGVEAKEVASLIDRGVVAAHHGRSKL